MLFPSGHHFLPLRTAMSFFGCDWAAFRLFLFSPGLVASISCILLKHRFRSYNICDWIFPIFDMNVNCARTLPWTFVECLLADVPPWHKASTENFLWLESNKVLCFAFSPPYYAAKQYFSLSTFALRQHKFSKTLSVTLLKNESKLSLSRSSLASIVSLYPGNNNLIDWTLKFLTAISALWILRKQNRTGNELCS